MFPFFQILNRKTAENRKTNHDVVFLLPVVCVSVGMYAWFIFQMDFIFMQYDAYYYASIADSLTSGNGFVTGVSIPPEPVRTPQNAVVLLHLLLYQFGVNEIDQRIFLIGFVNSVMLSFSSFFIYRLAINLGVDRLAALFSSLSVVVSFYYYAVLFQAINDIYYFTGCFACFYVVSEKKHKKNHLYYLIGLAVFIPLFRLSGLIVFLSFYLAAIFITDRTRKKEMLLVLLAALVTVVIVVGVLSMFSDGAGSRVSEVLQQVSLGYWYKHLLNTVTVSLPEAFIRFSWFTMRLSITQQLVGYVLSTLIFLAIFMAAIRSFNERHFIWFTLCLFVFFNLIFFQLYQAQPTRYIMAIGPVIILLIFYLFKNKKINRTLSAVYLVASVILTVIGFSTTMLPVDALYKKEYSKNMKKYIHENSVALYSYFPRVTYFLLEQSSYMNIENACKNSREGRVLVVAPEKAALYAINDYSRSVNSPIEYYILPYHYFDYIKSVSPIFYFKHDRVDILTLQISCQT